MLGLTYCQIRNVSTVTPVALDVQGEGSVFELRSAEKIVPETEDVSGKQETFGSWQALTDRCRLEGHRQDQLAGLDGRITAVTRHGCVGIAAGAGADVIYLTALRQRDSQEACTAIAGRTQGSYLQSLSEEGLFAERQGSRTVLSQLKDGLEGPILTGPDGKRSTSEDIQISPMKDLVMSGRHLDPVVAYLVATARTFALSNGRCLRGFRTRNGREVRIGTAVVICFTLDSAKGTLKSEALTSNDVCQCPVCKSCYVVMLTGHLIQNSDQWAHLFSNKNETGSIKRTALLGSRARSPTQAPFDCENSARANPFWV